MENIQRFEKLYTETAGYIYNALPEELVVATDSVDLEHGRLLEADTATFVRGTPGVEITKARNNPIFQALSNYLTLKIFFEAYKIELGTEGLFQAGMPDDLDNINDPENFMATVNTLTQAFETHIVTVTQSDKSAGQLLGLINRIAHDHAESLNPINAISPGAHPE